MKPSPTAYVILGFLSWTPMSGYDIKALADGSTRFFWAASYGQIYPELRRLTDAGLITGEDSPRGERKRKVYTLTDAGRSELREWLAGDPEVFELRDEGLLRLFFASASPTTAASTLEAKRRQHAETLQQFRDLEASGKPQGFALMVLRYGIELQEWALDWCDRAAQELEDTTGDSREFQDA